MNSVETSRRPSTGAQVANIVFGIWVVISPFVLGFSQKIAVKWSNIAVGIALILVSLAGEWGDEILEGLVVVLGAWLFESAFVFGFPTGAFLANNVIMAFVVIATAAMSDGLRL